MDQSRRFEDVIGENPGTDMRRPFARHANRVLRRLSSEDSNTIIDLGEHGEVPINHVRFRDAVKEGNLVAYIRQESHEPKVIIPTVVALGIVAAGIYKLRHKK